MKNHDFGVANCDEARDLRMTIWTDLEQNSLVLGPVNFSVGTLANKFNNYSILCNDGAPDLKHQFLLPMWTFLSASKCSK